MAASLRAMSTAGCLADDLVPRALRRNDPTARINDLTNL
jgi:hypothetical protein